MEVGTLLESAWVSVVRGCEEGMLGVLTTWAENVAKKTIKICGSKNQVCAEACQRQKLVVESQITDVSGASATRTR